MPLPAPATLVWVGQGEPSPAAERALKTWAVEKNAVLAAPVDTGAHDEPAEQKDASETCERLLREAREAIAADGDDEARALLARAEQVLRDHPELPESPWLMAEALRLGARAAVRRPRWDGEALALVRRADALEGHRAAAYGDVASAAPTAPAGDPALVDIHLDVHGRGSFLAYWDANPVEADVHAVPGEHHLRVVGATDGDSLWSGWVSVFVSTRLELWAKRAPACSSADFDGVHFASDGPDIVVPRGVGCGTWVLARENERPKSGLVVAMCTRDQCGPSLTLLDREAATGPAKTPVPDSTPGFPAWAKWTLAGAAAALSAGAILWATGAFRSDSGGAPTTHYEYEGSALVKP